MALAVSDVDRINLGKSYSLNHTEAGRSKRVQNAHHW